MQLGNLKQFSAAVIIIAVIGFGIYFLFIRGGGEEAEILFDEFGYPIEAQAVGQDLISLLEELQSVSFDSSLFRSPAFVNLTDYSVDLGTQPQGRTNPFEGI